MGSPRPSTGSGLAKTGLLRRDRYLVVSPGLQRPSAGSRLAMTVGPAIIIKISPTCGRRNDRTYLLPRRTLPAEFQRQSDGQGALVIATQ